MTVENGKPMEKNIDTPKTLKITSKTNVLPKGKPDKPTCPLVTFDLPYITFYYNQKLMLYNLNNNNNGDLNELVMKLKDGLSEALGYFYPLGGTLKQDKEGVLYIECQGEGLVGAEVIEAVAEQFLVSEVEDGENGEMLKELVPYNGVMNLEGLHRPLLAVQFTKLKDGVAIGCAFNHAVLDGSSTWHFMSAWSHLTREGPTAPISPLPFLDRAAARSVRVPLTLPSSPRAHELADPKKDPTANLVATVFPFAGPTVDLIKSQANAGLKLEPHSKPLSTFQSLGAHVWRAVCRARQLKPEDVTVFAIFADCRGRVDPPMPEEYFGNLIQAIFTGTAAGLLMFNPPEFGARILQKVIEEHDSEAIRNKLEEYEVAPKLFHYSDAGMNCVGVGSSPRFKVYDVDFGFGKPARVRSGCNNKFDGMVYLYPGRDGGKCIDVELTLHTEAMERLKKDEEFLMTKKVNDIE